ncbi:MAG: periplasmic heavy metal sensor [Deltaproteobacteria bacterium]|nr:periplasmic heavy metal sensor [Deltaproteobacteria bacterium]
MKKKILILTVFALIGSISLSLPNLFAFNSPMESGKWWYRPGVKDTLQLTPDQIDTINKIWMEHKKRLIDIKSDIGKTYLDLENVMSQPMTDRQEAYKLAERLGQLHSQQIEKRIKMAIDIRQELSIEQFEKLKGLRREFAQRLREKGPQRGKKGRPKLK